MAILHKSYAPHPNGLENHKIKFVISFNKELTNWARSQRIPVGYRVNVVPIEQREGNGYTSETFGAFTGFNDTLLEIDRQSPKRLAAAIEELEKRKEKYIKYFATDECEPISAQQVLRGRTV